MRIEYLPSVSPRCPLVRLYEFSGEEAAQLHDLVRSLADGDKARIELTETFPTAPGGCRLTLALGKWDQGILRPTDTQQLLCVLTAGTWDNIAGLVEPFTRGASGYQWLAGGEIALLLSLDGKW